MTAYGRDERAALAAWLDGLDSHTIYPVDELAAELRALGWRDPLPTGSTHAQIARAIDARGLGGELAPDDGRRLIAGFEVSRWLAAYMLGHAPGDRFYGRGSAHRANVAGLRAFANGG